MTTSSPTAFADLDPARQEIVRERVRSTLRQAQKDKESATAQLRVLMEAATARSQTESLRASIPPVFAPFLQHHRYKGAHGGRGSSKSWTFAALALLRCLEIPGTRIVCVREVQKSLEQSVKRLLEDLIIKHQLGHLFKVLNTHIETPGNGIIIFQGMQNHTAESIKSLEGYDVAWVEEAQSLSETSLTLLRPTIRKENSEIWFSWNPRRESDPVDVFLRGLSLPPGAVVVEASYKDNPFLPKVLQLEMEWDRNRDPDKYLHVWLGGYERHSEARVFKNWKVEEFDTPHNAHLLMGGDWGFADDPTVGVRAFIKGAHLYIDYEVYKVGCEIDDTPELFDMLGCDECTPHVPCGGIGEGHGSARNWILTADSARPETISYMQRHGYPRIVPARKGPGSIEEGVNFLKSYDIIIHPRCVHVIDEFTMYSYKKHPLTGLIMPVLSDKKNHTIDSTRYMIEAVGKSQVQNIGEWNEIIRETPLPYKVSNIVKAAMPGVQSGRNSSPFNIAGINSMFGR